MQVSFSTLLALGASVVSAAVIPSEYPAGHPLFGSSFSAPGNATYDYVVVGGGTAGLTVASRLAQTGKYSVAVVEAGSFYELSNSNYSEVPAYCVFFAAAPPINPSIDWGFFTTNQSGLNGRSLHYTAGKTLGGSSARNFYTYQRGTKGAYQIWADKIGDQAYTFDNLLPFFEKSTTFNNPSGNGRAANATPRYDLSVQGTSGPVDLSYAPYAQPFSSWAEKGLQEIGIGTQNGMESGYLNGSSYILSTIDPSTVTRESSETSYLWKVGLQSTQLIVYQSTLAQKILFNSQKKATGVVVNSAGAQYTISANKEVIVSSGTFNSPHLLMVSGVGPAATLQKYNIPVVANRPGVGQNMWDHVLGGPSIQVSVPTQQQFQNGSYIGAATQEYISQRKGPLTNFAADMIAWEKVPAPYRSSFTAATNKSLSQFSADWPEVELIMVSAYWGNQNGTLPPLSAGDIASIVVALVAPVSRGSVSISSADISVPPVINPGWLSDPADQQVAIAAFKRARQLLATKSLAPIIIGKEIYPGEQVQTDAQILEAIKNSFSTVYHAACTCAMGNSSDPMAVLDSKARVYGVSGLRVVDNSSPPVLVPGHPSATIYGLAEKIAADIIAGN